MPFSSVISLLPAQDRLLLVPPRPDAVTDQHVVVRPARLLVCAHRELPQIVHAGAGAAAIDRLAMNVDVNGVVAALFGRRRSDDHRARLVAGIAL